MDSIAMHKRNGLILAVALSCSLTSLAVVGQGAECLIKEGTRLAIAGDSITEQKLYSKFIETYLVACGPVKNVSVIQYGWSGDRAAGFSQRMENDLFPWKPTLVTTCFGMNDGGYAKYNDVTGQLYATNMWKIVSELKGKGVTVVVGGPGAVDSDTYRGTNVYNETLAQLSAIASNVATTNNFPFADVHQAMMSAMEKAKSAYGPTYHVAGGDGVHPALNGHLVMAYAFLRAMGLDGQIGTVEVDWKGGATASVGHKVLSFSNGVVTVESVRYPFCFWGADKDPNGTISILPFVPLQDHLNRFILKVKNLPAGSVDVKWGQQQKTFTADQLAQGINLASEFLENPFVPAFQKVMDQVAVKQAYETMMIKRIITNFNFLKSEFNSDSEIARAVDTINSKLLARQDEYSNKVKAAVIPVQHVITIMPK
jgi:lysophospholipase L1-like esterase